MKRIAVRVQAPGAGSTSLAVLPMFLFLTWLFSGCSGFCVAGFLYLSKVTLTMAVVTTLFDSSVIIFEIYRLLHNNIGLTRRPFFIAYGILGGMNARCVRRELLLLLLCSVRWGGKRKEGGGAFGENCRQLYCKRLIKARTHSYPSPPAHTHTHAHIHTHTQAHPHLTPPTTPARKRTQGGRRKQQ